MTKREGQRKQGSYFTMMTSQPQANRRRDRWAAHIVSESSVREVVIDTVHTRTCDRCFPVSRDGNVTVSFSF